MTTTRGASRHNTCQSIATPRLGGGPKISGGLACAKPRWWCLRVKTYSEWVDLAGLKSS